VRAVIEAELKIALDPAGMARLLRHPALPGLRLAPRQTRQLVSVYYDTETHALAAAGIALRLRRSGRRWVQTVKRRSGAAAGGFFAQLEDERPAPGGRLTLAGRDPDGALAAVKAAGGPLAPLFETRVRRVTERLAAPGGGEVELALDTGEIVAGDARAPVSEAEIELKSGEVGAVYAVARLLFPQGPVRFSALNKAARGYLLVRGEAEPAPGPRNAGRFDFAPDAPVEIVARDVFRDCLGQIAANMALVADSADPEGPHQVRVGLRRLRTAFAVFAPSLGADPALAEAARRLGQVAGRLRDCDVLVEEVVGEAAALGLDGEACAALNAALEARRERVRAEVRAELAAPASVGFLFDLGAYIEGRGWLVPSDHCQTGRLAAPIAEVAPAMLDKRRKRVRKRGRHIRRLDGPGLHELRKALKKLRYAVDMLAPIYREDRVTPYLSALKGLQDSFGSLNDAAMADAALTGPEAPGEPAAQRGVGWVLGVLAARAAEGRPRLFARWEAFADAKPFWG
jgi:inorganic triphosphatase YgiF